MYSGVETTQQFDISEGSLLKFILISSASRLIMLLLVLLWYTILWITCAQFNYTLCAHLSWKGKLITSFNLEGIICSNAGRDYNIRYSRKFLLQECNQISKNLSKKLKLTCVWAITRTTEQYFLILFRSFSISFFPLSSVHFTEALVKAFFLDRYL